MGGLIPGITGDLAKRKLIPALYRLYKKGDQAIIIGTGRREADISLIMKDGELLLMNLMSTPGKHLASS